VSERECVCVRERKIESLCVCVRERDQHDAAKWSENEAAPKHDIGVKCAHEPGRETA